MPADRDGLIDLVLSAKSWRDRREARPRSTGSGTDPGSSGRACRSAPASPPDRSRQGAKATTEGLADENGSERREVGGIRLRRARDVMLLMEGAMMLVLIHGDISYIHAAAKAAKRLVRRK